MKTLATFLGTVVLALAFLAAIATLGAFPAKWVINYLFSPAALQAVFGVARFDFWHALAFNFFAGWVFQGTSSNTSK